MTLTVLHLDTERGWRGGERQALWLAAELASRGHRSVVAARGDEPLALRARAADLEVIDCRPASEVDAYAAWKLRREILARRVDVVHAHTAHAAGLGALATLGTRVPLIVARRVDFPLRQNAGTRWKYSRAAAIIAVSRAVEAVLRRGGVDPSRIAVVPDGVDLARTVEPAGPEVLAALGVAAGAPLVVQVAQLVGHKDPVNFVRAFASAKRVAPDLQALLVGDGPLRAAVDAEVSRLALRGALHATGYRTDADSLLAAATVVCLSSREEGMGSVLLDAMALGRPIAATRAGGIGEIVVDGECGLLAPPGDPESLGAAIARLVADPALAARLANAGRARVRDFSVGRMCDRTLEVYDRAVARGRGSATARESAVSSDSSSVAP